MHRGKRGGKRKKRECILKREEKKERRNKWRGKRERERESREDRKEIPTSNIASLPSSFLLLLPALSRVSRDERAGRLGSREWIIINRYFRQSRPFILRHATPIIYRRFGQWREEDLSKSGERTREKESQRGKEREGGNDALHEERLER